MTRVLVVRTVLLLACAPFAYYLVALETARRFFSRWKPAIDARFTPPVSVLKPIRGLDPNAFDDFASFCRQDYPAYEILFVVGDDRDPAVPVIERLIREFPGRSITLLIGAPDLGPSGKINGLCRLAREARHELLVVSDGDIAVPADYLRRVVAPFRDPMVGAVTCLYRGRSNGGLTSNLEALSISTEFVPGVLVAARLEGLTFMLGATMAVRRACLAGIGGFEALVEHCADDFELGRRISELGYRIQFAGCAVETDCQPVGFREFFAHQLRWAVTVRAVRPWGYLGKAIVTPGLAWSVAAAWMAPSAVVAGAYLAAYLLLRLAIVHVVAVQGLEDRLARQRWWLVPAVDAVALVVSLVALGRNRIAWRGRVFELRQGRLVPAAAAVIRDDGNGRTASTELPAVFVAADRPGRGLNDRRPR